MAGEPCLVRDRVALSTNRRLNPAAYADRLAGKCFGCDRLALKWIDHSNGGDIRHTDRMLFSEWNLRKAA